MKKWMLFLTVSLSLLGSMLTSCKKEMNTQEMQVAQELRKVYSSESEFEQALHELLEKAGQYNIKAYLDTMPNGFPNKQGRTYPLTSIIYSILEKVQGHQLPSAVYDVYHFDGQTFSLISYFHKAYLAGDISVQTLVEILSHIPLPPIPVDGFEPPVEMVPIPLTGDCCKDKACNPEIKILVTWVHVSPCGNYAKGKSGYAANNTLTNMSGGQSYRFNAEITGCPCPGTLTHTVTTPAGASYGEGTGKDGSVDLLPVTSGTYTITFTYKVCDKTITKTFTLGVK